MTAKKPLFHADVQAKIVTGVNTLARAVCVTLGPKARTVVIEHAYGTPTIINSGVVVAASVAGLILATDCMIAQLPEPTPNAAMAPEM